MTDSTPSDAAKPGRSPGGAGASRNVSVDQRRRDPKLFKRRRAEYADLLGGWPTLTAAQRAHVERLAHLDVLLARHERDSLAGRGLPAQEYVSLLDRHSKISEALGLVHRMAALAAAASGPQTTADALEAARLRVLEGERERREAQAAAPAAPAPSPDPQPDSTIATDNPSAPPECEPEPVSPPRSVVAPAPPPAAEEPARPSRLPPAVGSILDGLYDATRGLSEGERYRLAKDRGWL